MTAGRTTDSSTRRRNRRRTAARSTRARLVQELGGAGLPADGATGPAALEAVAADLLGSGVPLPDLDDVGDAARSDRPRPAFAHASEAEMARILDFYRISWEYEPHTYPILWNLEGAVIESFSPDFWLPDLDLYLEMTTLRQRLVRKKNRKLRRIHELYPDIRVKLFYARDFRALMLKFGRLALVGDMSGSSGQVVPDRSLDEADAGNDEPAGAGA